MAPTGGSCWRASSTACGSCLQVGDGVKGLAEGDTVIPLRPLLGTWRALAVCKAGDLLKLPSGLLAWEHAALACHLCTAFRLLESVRSVKARRFMHVPRGVPATGRRYLLWPGVAPSVR